MKHKFRVKATMTKDLEYEAEDFEFPEDLDQTDADAVYDYLREYAREIDGGLFVEVDDFFGGSWDVYDIELDGEPLTHGLLPVK